MSPETYEEGDRLATERERIECDEHEDYLDAVQFGPVPEEVP